MKLTQTQWLVLLGAGVGLAFLLLPKLARKTAQSVATVGTEVIGGVIEGTVVGIGQEISVPATDKTQCQKDIDAGRTWDASFNCNAADFLKYVFGKT